MREITRIKKGYGLRPIRNERELGELVKFCIKALNEKHATYETLRYARAFNDNLYGTYSLVPIQRLKIEGPFDKHDWVLFTTIKLYEDKDSLISRKLLEHKYNDANFIIDVYDFIETYCGWYWD